MNSWEYCYIRKVYGSFARRPLRIELVFLGKAGTRSPYPFEELEAQAAKLLDEGWVAVPPPAKAAKAASAPAARHSGDLLYFRRLTS